MHFDEQHNLKRKIHNSSGVCAFEFPKKWVWKTLQEVCLPPQYGWTTKASQQGALRLLRTTDISTDSLNWDTVPFCSEEPPEKKKYLLKTGDIVISRAGSVGCSYLIKNPPKAVFASYLIRFRPLSMIDEYYLSFFLKSSFYWNTILAEKTGSTLPNVNATKLKRVPVPLPPLPEQRAIAHVLQTIQEAKATRQREIELERERKAALMDYLFSHGMKGEPHKQTEIGEIPESWEVVRLGNYCYKSNYGYTESANDLPVGPKFLRITDIQNDAVNWENVPYCICSDKIKEKYLLKTGDIVIARIGATTGKAYIIGNCPESVFASYLIRVRTKDNLLPAFLAQYFQTNNYWRQIDQSKGGRLKGGINIPILSNLVLPLPQLSEQQQIAKILQACDTKIAALEQEAQHLDELFHAMLDALMTGQRSAVPLIDTKLVS